MKKKLSQYGFLLLLVAASYQFGSSLVDHKHGSKYIWSDAEGYYMYLPAVVIYGGDFEKIPVRTKDHFRPYPGTKKIFTKYNYGVALMQAPFYLSAYAFRAIKGVNPKIYAAKHYSIGMLIAASVYGILGLFLLWKAMMRFFPDRKIRWLSLAVILLGTNLLFYMARAPGMSHAYSFFLASALVYLTPGLIEKPTFGKYLIAGFVAGLIVLIRPTNGLFLIYPLLYGVHSSESLLGRFVFLQKNWGKLAVAAIMAALLWVPQLCYWHYLSGNWFIDPYYTESFKFWDKPLVHYVLFSYLNGYFIYNPIMLFPVAALFFMLKKNYLNSWGSLFIFVASTYVFSSWWCWWFGGSYGHRCYVEVLPFLIFPTAFAFQKLFESRYKWLKISMLSVTALLVFYNIQMVVLYRWTWSEMEWNWEKYWEVVGKAFFL